MGDALFLRGENRGVIRLSSVLWPLATEAKRENTIIHEIAHVYADRDALNKSNKRAGHGPVWKKWMRWFGVEEPQRCFTYTEENFSDVELAKSKRRYQARYCFHCEDCGKLISITASRRTRWIKNNRLYNCAACGGHLPVRLVKQAKRVNLNEPS